MTKTCLLEISFRLLPGKRQEFIQSLPILTESGKNGIRKAVFYEEQEDPDHLFMAQEWIDLASLERYLKTDLFKTLMGGLRTLATLEDCRIVDLDPAQHSGQVSGYEIRHVQGRNIVNGD